MRLGELHLEWSHILKLATLKGWIMNLKDDSIQSMTWWLEMVKIARKCFDVLSKGEGQAMAWRQRNLARVKRKVLAFSWSTNQTMTVILKWRSKSWINSWKWLDTFGFDSHLVNGIKSRAQDGYAQGENQRWHVDTLIWWRLKALTYSLKKINSSGSNSFFIWSWVNRYAVL